MATYNVGPGETYETFSAFFAAVTPTDNDIIDGKGETFEETITIPSSGTAGNVITYQNIVVDGELTRNTGISMNNIDYVTCNNISLVNHLFYNIYVFNGSTNVILTNITTDLGRTTVTFNNTNTTSITGVVATNATDYVFRLIDVTNINIDDAVIGNDATDFCYGAVKTTGVFTGTITINDITSVKSTGYGVKIEGGGDGVSSASSYFKDCTFSDSAVNGFYGLDLVNITLNNLNTSNNANTGTFITGDSHDIIIKDSASNSNTGSGYNITGAAYDITLRNCVANGNTLDGFSSDRASGNDPYNLTHIACRSTNNGVDGLSTDGDGYTSHYASYNMYYHYCIADNNKNTGFAMIGTTSGEIINCVSYSNGNSSGPSPRGGIFLPTSGLNATTSKNWTVKNSIGYKDFPLALYLSANETTNGVRDYNCYLEYAIGTFATLDGAEISWATYNASHETNSINQEPYLDSVYRPSTSSPCIGVGVRIATLHDVNTFEGDYDGDPIAPYDLINMGAYNINIICDGVTGGTLFR